MNVAVGENGQLYGVNKEQEIFMRDGTMIVAPSATPAMMMSGMMMAGAPVVATAGTRWEKLDGGLIQIAVGGPNGTLVGGTNRENDIFMRTGVSGSNPRGAGWQKLDGKAKMVTFGPNGEILAIGMGDEVFRRVGMNAAAPFGAGWERVAGGLRQASVGGNAVWGVNAQDDIYMLEQNLMGFAASSPPWKHIDGKLRWVSVSADGMRVVGVNSAGSIYMRTGISPMSRGGSGWQQIDGGCAQICVSGAAMWCVNAGQQIYFREGMSPMSPAGTHWKQVDGGLMNVAVGENGQLYGVNKEQEIFMRC